MTDPRIEAAARALRERNMAGKITRDWDEVPRSQKKKWLDMAGCALTAADAAAWRPIETAPQDTNILTYYADGRVMPDQFPYRGMLEWQEQFDAPPTHWQPLPAPPTTPEPTP